MEVSQLPDDELKFIPFKQNPINSYDEKILDVLKKTYPKTLSSFAISLLTNIEHTRVCKKLAKLERYKEVQCMTASKKIKFWRLKNDKK